MTTVRIAHAEPRPGKLPNGGFQTRGWLVVLADDAGQRAVPVWLRGEPGAADLAQLVALAGRPPDEHPDIAEDLTARLLRSAGVTVTGVDIDVTTPDADELSPQAAVARIELSGPAGPRQVTAELSLGLAMAAAADAPLRLADAALDRLAVPVTGADLLGPLLHHVPPTGRRQPGRGLDGWPVGALPTLRPRFEPRNLDFADGLDRWDLDWSSRRAAESADRAAYTAAVDDGSAVLSAAVPRPTGSAALVQAVFADDYRGRTVVFRGEIRTESGTEQAGLRLEIFRHWWRNGRPREDHGCTVGGRSDWSGLEVTALIPEDADVIRFGVAVAGVGSIALRNPELRAAEPGHDV